MTALPARHADAAIDAPPLKRLSGDVVIRDVAPPGYVAVAEAARAWVVSERAARDRARELGGDGRSALLARTENGQTAWFVNAEHVIGRVGASAEIAGLAHLPAKDLEKALVAKRAIDRTAELTPTLGREVALEQAAREAGRKSKQWVRDQEREYGKGGLAALAPKYRRNDDTGTNGPAGHDPRAVEYFFGLYHHQNQISLTVCHELTVIVAGKNGWKWPASVSATRKWLKRVGHVGGACLARKGEREWGHRFSVYIEQDYARIAPNDLWVADSHECRFDVRDGCRAPRYWLVAIMDAASRVIVGWVLCEQPNQDVILSAMRRAFLDYGIPKGLKIDNGRDYGASKIHGSTRAERHRKALADALCGGDEKAFARLERREDHKAECTRIEWRGLLPELGVGVIFAQPYNARAKVIERFFRTFNNRFSRLQDSYVGKTNVDRPERMAKTDAAIRRMAQGKPRGGDLRRYNDIPTVMEARDRIEEWIGQYHQRKHRGLVEQGAGECCRPIDYYRAHLKEQRVADADALNLMMQVSGEYVVGANGVQLRIGGRSFRYGQYKPELQRFQGRKVIVSVDQNDVSFVLCWERLGDGNMRLICAAGSNERLAPCTTDDDVRKAIRRQSRARATGKAAQAQRRDAYRSVAAIASDGARKALPAPIRTGTDDAPLYAVQTSFDGQVSAAQDCAPPARDFGDDDDFLDLATDAPQRESDDDDDFVL